MKSSLFKFCVFLSIHTWFQFASSEKSTIGSSKGDDGQATAEHQEEESERQPEVHAVEITANPHQQELRRNTTSTTNSQCLIPCLDNFQDLLNPDHLIKDIPETQPDTLAGIENASIPVLVEGMLATESVPVYQFRQPKRISSAQLPFQLVLVEEMPVSHVIQPAASQKVSRDSWFLNYAWSIVIVCDCSTQSYQHVGWKFTRNRSDAVSNSNVDSEKNQNEIVSSEGLSSFYALIVRTATSQLHKEASSEPFNASQPLLQVFGLKAPETLLHELLQQKLRLQNTTATHP